jgi:hypothetical protein
LKKGFGHDLAGSGNWLIDGIHPRTASFSRFRRWATKSVGSNLEKAFGKNHTFIQDAATVNHVSIVAGSGLWSLKASYPSRV